MDSSENNKPSLGISLEDLPSEDLLKESEEAAKRRIEAFKAKKTFEHDQKKDARIESLSHLDNEEKLSLMSKVYEFDKKEPRFELLFLYSLPVVIKHLGLFDQLLKYMASQRSDLNILLDIFLNSFQHLHFLFRLSEILFVAFIFIKPPLRSTPLRFLLSFEGIELPKKLRIRSTDSEQRRKIKWNQIHSARLNDEYILALEVFDEKNESLGMLRWDLWKKDKKIFSKILAKYVSEKHPLRIFVNSL